jgi:hypothetical protein
MKQTFFVLFYSLIIFAGAVEISSPDELLTVDINVEGGKATYSVKYDGQEFLLPSRLGLKGNMGDFTEGLTLKDSKTSSVERNYNMTRTKASHVDFKANKLELTVENQEKKEIIITFVVSNNDIGFRYTVPGNEGTTATIEGEVSSFRFPDETTTFISPQSDPMIGFARSKPSYEEGYSADGKMTDVSQYKHGYIFPALFHLGNRGWALVGETGTTAGYVGCRLSDFSKEMGYKIEFPMQGENNGNGKTSADIKLPGNTPWRTITLGKTLKPIVETTITYDLVEPLYEPSIEYKPGRYTWSWLIWQDNSMNYQDQTSFIDLAGAMGYEYVLVDAYWDARIGYGKMEELSKYAQTKGVRLLLWYNSNGKANDAPQSPKDKMDTHEAREKEMQWMKNAGIAGIKVDFFGGDKQVTMEIYEGILYDANKYGLQVIFHGCTLPRGWEMLYPNFVASEAVLASENVYFGEGSAFRQPFDLTLHPFCRNSLASMDWGGIIMNRFLSRDNKSRHSRKTTDVFEMASGIIMQTSVQCVAMQPNNLNELPEVEINFLKELPTTWDETVFIDGYPGRFVVLARRHEKKWYVAGLNAERQNKELTLTLPMFEKGTKINYYTDKDDNYANLSSLTVDESGQVKVLMKPNGGFILN